MKGIYHNLAAIANLVAKGHEVTFRENDAIIARKGNKNVVLQELINNDNRFWRVPLNNSSSNKSSKAKLTLQVLSIYDCNSEKQLIQFYHATLLSQIKTTLLRAVKKEYLQGWSGLMT